MNQELTADVGTIHKQLLVLEDTCSSVSRHAADVAIASDETPQAPTMRSAVPLMRVRAGSAAVAISALCVVVSFFSVLWKLYPGSGSVAEENGGRDRIRCPLIKAAGLSEHLISGRFRVPVIRIYVSIFYFFSMS